MSRNVGLTALTAFESAPLLVWLVDGLRNEPLGANAAARAHGAGPFGGAELRAAVTEAALTGQATRIVLDAHVGAVTPLLGGDSAVLVVLADIADALRAGGDGPEAHTVPGVAVAGVHRVNASLSAATGDFYEAIPLDGGRIALAVGDVGQGTETAGAMGRLRGALLAYLLAGMGVEEVMANLGSFATRTTGAPGSTASLAVLDPASLRLDYVTAGHPPPLLIGANGTARALARTGGAPLGYGQGGYRAQTAQLTDADTVLLHTNGLLWLPGPDAERNAHLLLRSAARRLTEAGLSVEQAGRAIIEDLAGNRALRDEAVLLAARLQPSTLAPLTLVLPARPDQLRPVRRQFQDWLTKAGASQQDVEILQLTSGEAMTNAIEHAYPPEHDGQVEFSARLDPDGTVQVDIVDHGSWVAPRHDRGSRGRGLLLMRQCVDELTVRPTANGTSVCLRHRLRGLDVAEEGDDALLAAFGVPAQDGLPAGADLRTAYVGERVHAWLSGELDATAADVLGRQLANLTCGGTVPLSVDLSQVGHLSSAGVTLLFELAHQATTAGCRLHVHAATGSSAAFVLANTGLHAVAEVMVVASQPDEAPASFPPS
ncbi:anti-sigma regulatory factor (Ser/Thr protein kinase)/anti-anti-sigma regulatory factor [Crossiella equi]|uniref:Anti-sigma regulatory factor (Ser/Thr protein kinase)/anti-anti-sigma regulatory factor n=1 Tax=Crossiella equi TaxID=130796 RepID=A0ABS5A9E9_9PSEU|nr:SpoIIE family protein phosphatase [Crossiella equi]MBP2473195.1 anti-sigma regulatory factor (Ser/Thr protein kinase)/anti-anti-sigma regulatory factor [Crossiella equi]